MLWLRSPCFKTARTLAPVQFQVLSRFHYSPILSHQPHVAPICILTHSKFKLDTSKSLATISQRNMSTKQTNGDKPNEQTQSRNKSNQQNANNTSSPANQSANTSIEDDMSNMSIPGISDTQKITPWEVAADSDKGVDYDKLINQFGCSRIDDALLARCEKLTGKPVHPWLKRQLFFSHRDFDQILDYYEKKTPFYLYTGRGPSSESLHLGHLIPFMMTKWLQETFNVPLVIQLTDDEKFFWKNLTLEETQKLAIENIRDIIACGFDVEKTFIFIDTQYIQHLYPIVCKIEKCFTLNSIRAAFGFDLSDHCGKFMFPAIQAAPSFNQCFPHIFPNTKKNIPCLIPCAIDQDPYFRLTRDAAPKLGFIKPALIHSKFFPALQGSKTKMNASDSNSAIFMTDSERDIEKKIKRYAFSGGGQTLELHQKHGGNLDIDVPYQWLQFFQMDDHKLQTIATEYSAGRMSTAQIKQELIQQIIPIVKQHQQRRAQVTNEMVETFTAIRRMQYK